MKMNNKKGHVYLAGLVIAPAHSAALVGTVGAFKIAFIAIAIACAWHIPAWEKAKDNHTEAAYQAQKMWPQEQFAKLGKGNAPVPASAPVGGYWEGLVLAGK